MDVAADYVVPDAFIGWRREGRWYRGGELVDGGWSYSMLPLREKRGSYNTHFRRERSMQGGSWFPCGGASWRCNGSTVAGIWIDAKWKTTSRANWAERLFELNNVVENKEAAKIEWVGKERFLDQRKIVKNNLGYFSLNKKLLN
jgi:hypothetical protein